MVHSFFNPRARSLLRGGVLVFFSLGAAILLSGFPRSRANPWIAVFVVVAAAGMADHLRCYGSRWSWYHGGVILLVYMDLMALSMILFLLLYPYAAGWMRLR